MPLLCRVLGTRRADQPPRDRPGSFPPMSSDRDELGAVWRLDRLGCRRECADILAAVTNDIFTREDQEFLIRNEALPKERIRAIETGE